VGVSVNRSAIRFIAFLIAASAQPACAQLIDSRTADGMLRGYATADIQRCTQPDTQKDMPLDDVINTCGGAIDALDAQREAVSSDDAGRLGVIDMLEALLAGGIARRLYEADGEPTRRVCVAMVRHWRSLDRIRSSAFEPGFAAQINSMREAAWEPAYKCRQAFPEMM
jgi:hypothetical protein